MNAGDSLKPEEVTYEYRNLEGIDEWLKRLETRLDEQLRQFEPIEDAIEGLAPGKIASVNSDEKKRWHSIHAQCKCVRESVERVGLALSLVRRHALPYRHLQDKTCERLKEIENHIMKDGLESAYDQLEHLLSADQGAKEFWNGMSPSPPESLDSLLQRVQHMFVQHLQTRKLLSLPLINAEKQECIRCSRFGDLDSLWQKLHVLPKELGWVRIDLQLARGAAEFAHNPVSCRKYLKAAEKQLLRLAQ